MADAPKNFNEVRALVASKPLPDPPWERIEDEPIRWYDRFNRYLLLGPTRSALQAAELEGEASTNWSYYSRMYRWQERAEAWDEEQLRQLRVEVEFDRLASRKRRIATLERAHKLIDEAMLNLIPEEATFRNVMEALTMIFPELRIEYNDEPAKRIELTGKDGGPVETETDDTDPRELLVKAIAKYATARGIPTDIIDLTAERSE